jgi:hypothetical protein
MHVKDTGSESRPKPEATAHRQEVFNDWLAKYLRRLDRVSGEDSTSVEPRPAGREPGNFIENRERNQA